MVQQTTKINCKDEDPIQTVSTNWFLRGASIFHVSNYFLAGPVSVGCNWSSAAALYGWNYAGIAEAVGLAPTVKRPLAPTLPCNNEAGTQWGSTLPSHPIVPLLLWFNQASRVWFQAPANWNWNLKYEIIIANSTVQLIKYSILYLLLSLFHANDQRIGAPLWTGKS